MGNKHGRAWIEATYRTDESISVDLDMGAEIPYWFNADVDISVTAEFKEEDGEWKFKLEMSNLEPSTDFDWLSNTMGFLLPCGPVLSVVLDEGIPDCITYLEKHIDERVENSFQPYCQKFCNHQSLPPAGRIPQATLSANADINLACIEAGNNGDLEFIRINGGTVVLEAAQ